MNIENTYDWYRALKKPRWSPPAWLFAPVWTILYIAIAISFGTVFYKASTGSISFVVALPFVLNLIFNFAFTPIQFRLKNNFLALIDILLVLFTLIWSMTAIAVASLKLVLETGGSDLLWIALANIPYLLWVLFATILQLTITIINKK